MWVSKEEIAVAKKYDLLEYLSVSNPGELKRRSSNEYHLRTHDSLTISNGKWYWHSRGIGGRSALDYLIKVEGYEFKAAVKEIGRAMEGSAPSFFISKDEPNSSLKREQGMLQNEKKADISDVRKNLILPEKNLNAGRAKAYLMSRGIDEKLIDMLVDKGYIFESKRHGSVVFVGFDEKGNPAHAMFRATNGSKIKGDMRGSKKEYAFRFDRKDSEEVFVFEGAIDLLSYLTICKQSGIEHKNASYISTAGVAVGGKAATGKPDDGNEKSYRIPAALARFLDSQPNIRKINLCFDNDEAGRNAASVIAAALKGRYEVEVLLPEKGKDYNEHLMNLRKEGD